MEDDEQLQSVIYFLSDHVCSAIEAGDAILTQTYEPDEALADLSSEEILVRLDEFRRFLDRIRHYEYLVLTRLNQARHWGTQLRYLDPDFKPVIDLFSTATDMVADANGLLGEDEEAAFNGAGEPQQFLQSRCLAVQESNEDGEPRRVTADENYLLGGKILLAGLMEVCETFHDALEARYAAFSDDAAAVPVTVLTDVEAAGGGAD